MIEVGQAEIVNSPLPCLQIFLENERVTFIQVLTIIESPLPLALVHYSVAGARQQLALRIDFEKHVFLNYFSDAERGAQLFPTARNIVKYLGKMHDQRMASLQF